ncbi:MAG: phosphoribosylaminoimidazolesuccinocarboxamide synthase [Candidatus Altiarchaeales archaeon ex4484_96]|nr:MAG: phosphoribosylaminoimidazolesuccinocarboxamide synthase [Candidatus Altiarchaeales archaeon ex4484_96]
MLLETNLPLKHYSRGKVRDIYDLDDKLLIIATDRISAFDCVLPDAIPCKGQVLTQLSAYWFDYTCDIIKNHLISTNLGDFPDRLDGHLSELEGRTMLVKKTERIDVECVVRGYLAGSGLSEYKVDGTVCGVRLPSGLVEYEKLDEPIFTPAIKASSGHDMNVSFDVIADKIGSELAEKLKETSIKIYDKTSKHAQKRGIIIADTKFEYGLIEDELILIDEILTPDSSRFWPAQDYCKGVSPKSFDKQYVRDYLNGLEWDKKPPAPKLPQDVIKKTKEKYLKAYLLITGSNLPKNIYGMKC